VLFTGYYTPIYTASRTRTAEYRFPLYGRPADLVSDPRTGEVKGRRVGDHIEAYPPRIEIEGTRMLAGSELVWLANRLDAYIIEVQGSAKLNMIEGDALLIGYAGTNGHEYASLRRLLIEDKKINKHTASFQAKW